MAIRFFSGRSRGIIFLEIIEKKNFPKSFVEKFNICERKTKHLQFVPPKKNNISTHRPYWFMSLHHEPNEPNLSIMDCFGKMSWSNSLAAFAKMCTAIGQLVAGCFRQPGCWGNGWGVFGVEMEASVWLKKNMSKI